MRVLIAALIVVAAAAPLRAEPPSDPLNWLGGPIAPHLFALDLDDRGLPRWPHDPVDDIKNGVGVQWSNRLARHFTEGSRQGKHLTSALRTEGRLGAAFDWSQFDAGAFNSLRRPDLIAFHVSADLSEKDALTLEYGFGLAVLWADRTYVGPSLLFTAEQRLNRPCTLFFRYAPAVLSHTSLLHDVTGGVSANWKALGVEAGYRGLVNGLRSVYGPEVALRLWL